MRQQFEATDKGVTIRATGQTSIAGRNWLWIELDGNALGIHHIYGDRG